MESHCYHYLTATSKATAERIHDALIQAGIREEIILLQDLKAVSQKAVRPGHPVCGILYAENRDEIDPLEKHLLTNVGSKPIPLVLITSEGLQVPRKKTNGFAAVFQEPKSPKKWPDITVSISKLSRDRKLFWELFESSRDALFLVNREGIVEDYNGNAAKLCAGIAEKIAGKPLFEFFEKESKNGVKEAFRGSVQGRGGERFAGELIGGLPVAVWFRRLPDDDVGGNLVVSTIRDQRQGQQIEGELRDIREQLKVVFNDSPIGVIHLDSLGRIVEVNRWVQDNLVHLFKSQMELSGRSFSETEIGLNLDLQEVVCDLLRGQKFHKPSLSLKDRFGNKRATLSVSGFPLFGPLGEVSGGVLFFEDVTDKWVLEENMARFQMLETAGSLAGALALDFKNLLGTILSHAAVLKNQIEPDSPYFDGISVIESASQSAVELADRLRSVTRRGSGEFRCIDLNDIIQDVTALVRRAWKRRMVFSLELDSSVLPIAADEVQIQRALLNLYVNAYEAMPNGGTVRVRSGVMNEEEAEAVGFENAPKGGVWVLVKDEGVGMLPAMKEKLFSPFFSTKSEDSHPGLGLSSVYEIVKQHQGEVRVESQLGRGSTFTLYFPAAPEKFYPSDLEESITTAEGADLLLLVDGEPVVLSMGKRLLEAGGYRVIPAMDGEQAKQLYLENQHHVDLIILDPATPYINGRDLLQDLLAVSQRARVLLASGCTSESEAHAGLAGGTAGFIQKPYRMKCLLEKVREMLERKEAELDE